MRSQIIKYNPVHPPSIFVWETIEGLMHWIEITRKCVVFVGAVDADLGGFSPVGTGFLIAVFEREIEFDYIVTCNHVIKVCRDNTWVRINLVDGGSECKSIPQDNWFVDKANDIAISPCPHWSRPKYDVARIHERDFGIKESLESPELYPGEEVFLVGLFTSHYGGVHNIPI
ncbi:MAG TPA: hypothetical protein VEF34_21455, partial [Syntrophobacteraceae bacterium]|nr:hypothetical protein [Syntrophobacteraceae bacterium]